MELPGQNTAFSITFTEVEIRSAVVCNNWQGNQKGTNPGKQMLTQRGEGEPENGRVPRKGTCTNEEQVPRGGVRRLYDIVAPSTSQKVVTRIS